jgi:hypothetical protein
LTKLLILLPLRNLNQHHRQKLHQMHILPKALRAKNALPTL